MYLLFSVLIVAFFLAAGVAWALFCKRETKVLRDQLVAFHEAGLKKDKELREAQNEIARLRGERDEVLQAGRERAVQEMRNLLSYNGTAHGQEEIVND